MSIKDAITRVFGGEWRAVPQTGWYGVWWMQKTPPHQTVQFIKGKFRLFPDVTEHPERAGEDVSARVFAVLRKGDT